MLACAALFWSGNFVIGRGIQGQLPPLTMAFWRWMVASLVLLPFVAAPMWRARAVISREWKTVALLGALGAGTFNTLVYIGLGSTTATNALLLNSAIPVLIALIGWVFMGQRVSAAQALGIGTSLAGVAVIIFRGDLSLLLSLHLNEGDIWVFIAMITWAIYTLLLKWRPADLPPMPFLGATVMVGALVNLPFFLFDIFRGVQATWSWASIGTIAYIGVFPSVLAYLFWNRGVADVGPARSGLFVHLMPVFGTLLAVIFLGESLHGYHGLGIVLILSGIVLASRNPAKP
jgi:drug/metabolite transporter (DMT)-like permease